MFAPIAVDNIDFPQSSSMSTLDFIPESFEAFQAYSNFATSSTYTTQSFIPSPTINDIMRWGMGPNNQILGIKEGTGGTVYKWDANTDTMTTHGTQSAGTVRNIVWDNLTNSWVICGTTSFVKISCDNLSVSSSISVPSNTGTEYAAVVAYGGKAYGLPYVSVGASTSVAIFDLVNNTSTTSAVTTNGNNIGFWSAVLTSVGTIYFVRITGGTNSIYEYNPQLDTGSNFASLTGTIGYGTTNLPDGNVFVPELGIGNCYIINPVNKNIQTLTTPGFGFLTGICVGQTGNVYGMGSSSTAAENGIWGFNPYTNVAYKTQYDVRVPNPGSSRGFQDIFSLSDGRLILMPGTGNSGVLDYYTYLTNPNNNTFTNIGIVNPILNSGKGL